MASSNSYCPVTYSIKKYTTKGLSMNKAQLVIEVQKKLGGETSKAAAERAIDAVIECIKKGIKKDKTVQMIGFGTFSVTKRAARTGVNPQTGEKLKIKASKSVKFKPGTALKALV